MLNTVSPTTWESIGNLALGIGEMAGGIGMMIQGFAVGTAGNAGAPVLAALAGAAMMAGGALSTADGFTRGSEAIDDMFARGERKEEFDSALDYLEKNGVGILS
jgi:hypothetical protein